LPLFSSAKIFLATPGKSTIGPSLEKNPSDAHVYTTARQLYFVVLLQETQGCNDTTDQASQTQIAPRAKCRLKVTRGPHTVFTQL